MTRFLLDTHIWLWGVVDPSRLSSGVAEALEDERNELWLSPISIWELTVLHRKRRVLANQDLEVWLRQSWEKRPFKEAGINFEVAREMAGVELPHRDPADHFLVATAKVFELTLVTADQHLLNAPGISVLANK